MKFFRMQADGVVTGVLTMTEEDARANLTEGEFILPFDDKIAWRNARWSGKEWESCPEAHDPRHDYKFMRASGYNVSDQVGALMKMVESLLNGAAPEQSAREEFDQLVAHNRAIKAAHPKNN